MYIAAGFCSKLFRDARALVFGLAVFTFSWVCWRGGPEWNDRQLRFVAGALLAAATLILVKKVWSNFAAAVLGGYVPLEVAYWFSVLPKSAEVPFLSLRHLAIFVRDLFEADGAALLFFALSVLILACSAQTLKRLSR